MYDTVTFISRALALSFFLVVVPGSSPAQPFDDDGQRDAWISVGIGAGLSEQSDETAISLHSSVTGRRKNMTVSARYTGQLAFLADDTEEIAILWGLFLPLGRLKVVPSAGIGRAWGTYDACLLCDGTGWGPHESVAYEIQFLHEALPWAGLTAFGSANRSNGVWGLVLSARLGTFFGDT